MNKSWNWGLTFLPLWIAFAFECCGGCYGFFCTSALAHIEVQEAMADHFAKEQEAKSDGDEESKDNDKEKTDAEKTEGGASAKTDTAEDKASNMVGGPKAEKSEKSTLEEKVEIDTAVSVETSLKTEKPDAESEADGAKSEEKEPDDGDEDDEFMFEMDEDTFHFYQQAEVEAENKATEAQSKAISSFCNIIFQTIIAALFVAKLNQVYEERDDEQQMDGTSSFSTFWVLFPFLLISGCVISCFACAIFGAANIDTAMSSEDAAENGDNEGGDEEAAGTNTNEAAPVIPTPPSSQGDEEPKQKNKAVSNAQVVPEISNDIESGDGAALTKGENSDTESAMDDLD